MKKREEKFRKTEQATMRRWKLENAQEALLAAVLKADLLTLPREVREALQFYNEANS